MNLFLYLILAFNSLGLIYLAYLIIKKYPPQKTDLHIPASSGIQKFALVRYNPFDDLGSDQSFSIALLDESNSGVLITSLHHRNFTRVYAKSIKNGDGDSITLSKEEKSVIVKAIKH